MRVGQTSVTVVFSILIAAAQAATGAAADSQKFTIDGSSRLGQMGFSISFDGNQAFAGAPGLAFPGRGYLVDLTTGGSTELLPSAQERDGLFGFTSQVDAGRILVGDPGSPFRDVPAQGAVYVYDAATGQQLSRFESADGFSGDEFGFGVNLHGNLAAIGAPNLGVGEGAAYLYDLNTGNRLHKLTAADPLAGSEFGADVAVNDDYVLVGAPANFGTLGYFPGATYVFDTTTGNQLFKLRPQDSLAGDEFGFDMAVSGDLAVIGAPLGGSDQGRAYVFDLQTGTQRFALTSPDSAIGDDFGAAVAIEGDLIAVGASGLEQLPGAVYLYDARTGRQLDKIVPDSLATNEAFGLSVALRGNQLLVGAPSDDTVTLNSGAFYRFELDLDRYRLIGDFDGSGALDVADIDLLTRAVANGSNNLSFDLNGNGTVESVDREVWVNDLFGTYFGDANLDGQFGTRDLVAVLQGGQYERLVSDATWATGDWNGDLNFTTSDLVVALSTGGYEQGPRSAVQAVPEPTSAVLAMIGTLAALGRLRRWA